MSELEIFLQGEGIAEITLVRVPSDGTVRAILDTAQEHGMRLTTEDKPIVLLENNEEELELQQSLQEAGVERRSRVHVHRCHRIEVNVNFNAAQKMHTFRPAITMQRVKLWAAQEFGLSKGDASEHTLQLCGSTIRPHDDIHIGTLVQHPHCNLCFDLVPKQRVEG